MLQEIPHYMIPLDIFPMRSPIFITARKCKDRKVHPIITSHRHYLKPNTIGHPFPPRIPSPLILQGSWSPISAWIKASRGNPWALPWRSPQPGQRNTTLDSLNNGINVFPIFTFIKMLILMKLLSMGIQHCKIWLQLCSGLRSFGPPWTQEDAYQWLQGVIEQSAHIELSHRKET